MKELLTLENLINIVMVITWFNSFWWLIAKVTGPLMMRVTCKGIFGLCGLVLPLLYFLKYFSII